MAAHNSRVYYWGESSGPIRGDIIELARTGSTWTSDVAYTVTSLSEVTTPTATAGLSGFAVNGAQPRVYYLSREALIELAWTGSKWDANVVSQYAAAPGIVSPIANSVAGFALHGADSRVYYSDPEHYIIEAAWAGSRWITTPIARDLGAPTITEDGVMVSFAVNGSASRVYYFDEKITSASWPGPAAGGSLTLSQSS